jgi:hypothetical protein
MCHEKQAPRQISSLEPKAHDITRRVDVVPPKQLKAELNLGEIGMRIGIWPGRLYSAVPDAICFGILLTLYSLCMRTTRMNHSRIS